jgi:hypothetical protein
MFCVINLQQAMCHTSQHFYNTPILKGYFINAGMLKNPKQDIEPSCGVFSPSFSRQSIYVVYKTPNLAYSFI